MTAEGIKGYIVVGGEQACALQSADVKVIANTGNPGEGMSSVMDLFTSKGGTHLAASVEAFAQSSLGKAFLDKAIKPAVQPAAPIVAPAHANALDSPSDGTSNAESGSGFHRSKSI